MTRTDGTEKGVLKTNNDGEWGMCVRDDDARFGHGHRIRLLLEIHGC